MSSEGLWVTAGTGRVAQRVKGAGGGRPHASERVPTLTVPQALLSALDVSQLPRPAPTALLHVGHGLGERGASQPPPPHPCHPPESLPRFLQLPIGGCGPGASPPTSHMWWQDWVLPERRGAWPGAFHRPYCPQLVGGHQRSEPEVRGPARLEARAAQGSTTQTHTHTCTQHPQRPTWPPLWVLGPPGESGAQQGVCGP